MNKAAVAAISVAAVLFAGGTSLEGTTFVLTHSANPYNLKLYYVAKQKGEALDESVKKFVDNKGTGTLTATKDGNKWTYNYAEPVKAETQEQIKNETVAEVNNDANTRKGWKAVAQYLNDNASPKDDASTEEPNTNTTLSGSDVVNSENNG